MKINIKDLNWDELLFLAEDLICILDCRASDDDEYETPDDLVRENLKKTPVLLDMLGWHEDADTVRRITLENIHDFKDYLSHLEFSCPPYTSLGLQPNVRYFIFEGNTVFKF